MLTCFSNAVGTSRLSSDKLLFIRSRRLFSIIYPQNKMKWIYYNRKCTVFFKKWHNKMTTVLITLLCKPTPLLFFLAIICDVVVGEFDRITELALCLRNSWEDMSGAESHYMVYYIYLRHFPPHKPHTQCTLKNLKAVKAKLSLCSYLCH